MKKISFASITISALLLAGCSATSVTPQGQQVVIVQSLPQEYSDRCQFIGEVAGGISHKMGRRFLRRGTCTFSSSGTAIYGVSLIHNQLGLDALVDCFKN